MTKSAIKALIFDMGRVLVDLDFSAAMTRFPQTQLDIGRIIRFSAADDPTFIAFERGEISPEDFHRYVCGLCGITVDFEVFRQMWTSIFREMPGMEELAGELRSAGRWRLGLLSDTDPLHWAQISQQFPWIPEIFTTPTLSFREKICKPAAEIFRRAAAHAGFAPEECLFIDDRADNVAGAQAVGMRGYRFTGTTALRETLNALTEEE